MAAVPASLLLVQCVVTMLAGAATADTQYSAQTFVDLQNAARADVGVAPLAWDDTLAAYAQRYAGERKGDCKLVHSNGPYGENIFWGSEGADWTAEDAVASWVDEKQYYNCSDGSCAARQVCSHYTQIVWANTTRVGCAAVSCGGYLGTFILCEYDPRGNVPGVRPYAGCGQFNRSAQSSPQDFLNLQNVARADVGVGMLSWDSTVATYAEGYAQKRKGDCKLVDSNGPYGESIFWGSESGDWTAGDAVASWLREMQYYNCSDGSCATGQVCSHYTQIVWANTTRVGCAAVACDGNGGTFILCEYDPPGNVPGVRPYAGCGQFNSSAKGGHGPGQSGP